MHRPDGQIFAPRLRQWPNRLPSPGSFSCTVQYAPPEGSRAARINVLSELPPARITFPKQFGRHSAILGRIKPPAAVADDRVELNKQPLEALTAIGEIQRQGEPVTRERQHPRGVECAESFQHREERA